MSPWKDSNNWVSYLSLVEDRELDARAEQLNREDKCAESGHDLFHVTYCRRCHDMFEDKR